MRNFIYLFIPIVLFASCEDDAPEWSEDLTKPTIYRINDATYEGFTYETDIEMTKYHDVTQFKIFYFHITGIKTIETGFQSEEYVIEPDSIPFTISGVDTAYGFVKWNAQDPQTIEIVYSARAEGDTSWNNYRITH